LSRCAGFATSVPLSTESATTSLSAPVSGTSGSEPSVTSEPSGRLPLTVVPLLLAVMRQQIYIQKRSDKTKASLYRTRLLQLLSKTGFHTVSEGAVIDQDLVVMLSFVQPIEYIEAVLRKTKAQVHWDQAPRRTCLSESPHRRH
jgi:hypothetical protein